MAEMLEQIQKFWAQGFELYESVLQEIIGKMLSVYQSYPYLLVLLLILVPLGLSFVFWLCKIVVDKLQHKRRLLDTGNEYFKISVSILIWLVTESIYSKVYISLFGQFQIYEKVIFTIALSVAKIFVFFNCISFFAQNADDELSSSFKNSQTKLKSILKSLKYYILFYFTFSHLLSNYLKWEDIGFWVSLFGLIHITRLSKKHRDLFKSVLDYAMGNLPSRIEAALLGPLRILTFFLVLLIGLFYRLVFALSFFEVTKKLSAKIIRHQVEKVSGNEVNQCVIPEHYVQAFKSLELTEYKPSWFSDVQERIYQDISDWEEDSGNESFLHIIGDPGSGRRSLIDLAAQQFQHLNPLKIDVPRKIIGKEEFQQFISQEISRSKEKPRLVIFEYAENFFLNTLGGFDALKEMFQNMNRSGNEFFWINVFDYYPWMHIEDFFGHIHPRQRIILKGFTDDEIKQLILSKNKKLGARVTYDRAIYEATAKKDAKNQESNVATQFFRMIWEQSNGNPKMSQDLWLQSIKYFNESENHLRIGLPERKKSSVLRDLTIDTLFVYNSLIKHSRMSFEDCCRATHLPERVVRFALLFGENEKFLIKDQSGNFRIAREWYGTVVGHLKTKNLIYG